MCKGNRFQWMSFFCFGVVARIACVHTLSEGVDCNHHLPVVQCVRGWSRVGDTCNVHLFRFFSFIWLILVLLFTVDS